MRCWHAVNSTLSKTALIWLRFYTLSFGRRVEVCFQSWIKVVEVESGRPRVSTYRPKPCPFSRSFIANCKTWRRKIPSAKLPFVIVLILPPFPHPLTLPMLSAGCAFTAYFNFLSEWLSFNAIPRRAVIHAIFYSGQTNETKLRSLGREKKGDGQP